MADRQHVRGDLLGGPRRPQRSARDTRDDVEDEGRAAVARVMYLRVYDRRMRRTLATLVPVVLAAGSLLVVACSSDDPAGTSSASSSSGGDNDGGSSGTSGASGTSGSSGSSGTSGTSGTSGSSGGSGTLVPGKTTRTIMAAGKSRSVIVVVPTTIATSKLPLVIALHGNGDTNSGFITMTTTLEALAESKGFVLAAPQGITQNVTVGSQTVPNVDWDAYRSAADGNIDLPLLDAIRTDIVGSGSVDTKKLIVFGYPQGGYLSFRYGMDTSATLACAGLIGAANPLGPQLTAAATPKIPVALQIGTADGAIGQARSTKADLEAKAFPLDYHEIAGAGHVPVAGGVTVPLTYCLGQTLP